MEECRKTFDSIRHKERPLPHETKNGRLRKGKSFKFCTELLESAPNKSGDVRDKSNQTILQEIMNQSELKEPNPIILVPKAPKSGNLCLLNAKEFFVNGRYVDPERIKIKDSNGLESNIVKFSHPINDQDVNFEVCDDIISLKQSQKM